jgi:hypothetical protein
MAIAWDEHKPPQLDLISDCVHCGFCLCRRARAI